MTEQLNKKELVREVANRAEGVNMEDVRETIEVMTEVVRENVEEGRTVSIYPLCKFYRRELPARTFVTPDGTEHDKPPRYKTGVRVLKKARIED